MICGQPSGSDTVAASGTTTGNLMSGTLTVTNSPTDEGYAGFMTHGIFALTKP